MKHRVSFVCVLACALCLVAGLAGCASGQTYQPEAKSPVVSSPAIAVDGTLRVGVEGTQSAPFTLEANDEASGLDVDMAAAIADEMGLSLEIVDVKSDGGQAALENGDVDILMSAVASDKSGAVWVSDPYVPTAIALFAQAGSSEVPTRESAPVIAAQSASTSAWAVSTAFGDEALKSSKDLMSAFSSLETGEAGYVAADAVIGVYAALYQNVDAAPIALLEQPSGYCVAVAADNAELQQAVADALAAISQGGIADVIEAKWLGAALDLESLPVVESSQQDETSAPQESSVEEGGEASDTTADAASAVEDGPDAGANAIVPNAGAQGTGNAGTQGTGGTDAQGAADASGASAQALM